MKTMRWTSLILLLLLASCTIEKRHYNSGYHIEWFSNAKPNPHIPLMASLPSIKVKSVREPEIKLQVQQKEFTIKNYVYAQRSKHKANKTPAKPVEENYYAIKAQQHEKGGLLIAIGLVCIVVGILGTLLTSADLYSIVPVLILFLILFIAGFTILVKGIVDVLMHHYYLKKEKSPDASHKAQSSRDAEVTSRDIVYLKNGKIIRGQIIEMIPNEKVTIETDDKRVFEYKMDKVSKITRGTIK